MLLSDFANLSCRYEIWRLLIAKPIGLFKFDYLINNIHKECASIIAQPETESGDERDVKDK